MGGLWGGFILWGKWGCQGWERNHRVGAGWGESFPLGVSLERVPFEGKGSPLGGCPFGGCPFWRGSLFGGGCPSWRGSVLVDVPFGGGSVPFGEGPFWGCPFGRAVPFGGGSFWGMSLLGGGPFWRVPFGGGSFLGSVPFGGGPFWGGPLWGGPLREMSLWGSFLLEGIPFGCVPGGVGSTFLETSEGSHCGGGKQHITTEQLRVGCDPEGSWGSVGGWAPL